VKVAIQMLMKLVRPFGWWMLLAAGFGFLTIGSSIGLLMTSAFIIAKAALLPSIAELQVAIVGVRFFGLSRGLFRYVERLVAHYVTFKILARLRVWFFQALAPRAPAGLLFQKSGDLLRRAVADVEQLQHIYLRILAPPLVAVPVSILMVILFSFFSIRYAIVILTALLFAGVGVPWLTLIISKNIGRRLVDLRSLLSSLTVETMQGLPELVLYDQVSVALERFQNVNILTGRIQRKKAAVDALNHALMGWITMATVVILCLVVVPDIESGALEGVYLAVLTLGAMAAFEAVTPLPETALLLRENLHTAQRLSDIIDVAPELESTSVPKPESFDIEFKHVGFTYPSGSKGLFSDFSLKISEGEHVAITGASGAGKSTLVNLLMRFWDVTAGEILLGDVPLLQFSQQQLGRMIGVVPQNPHLFSGTVGDNLRLARPDATEEELDHVCRSAMLKDRLLRLPQGYNTWIGEHGTHLSGGERQRLAIARTLLLNRPILVLDEPTVHLDRNTANAVLHRIAEEYRHRTLIVISHYIEETIKFDRIIIFDPADNQQT